MESREFSRREFVATSLTCLATAGLATVAPGVARAEEKPAATAGTSGAAKSGSVITRKLGRTGLEVPIVSMGAGACNDPTIVQACYEAGIRLFDTSDTYAYGRNEQMLGTVLSQMKVRDKSVIVTKAFGGPQRNATPPEGVKAAISSSLDGSLQRLKTDYVDVLQLYDVRSPEPLRNQAINDALAAIKREGKARFVGLSTHSDMANVINAAVEAGVYDVILTSFNFTMATDTAMMNAVANAASKGVAIIAMKVLAGGARFPNPETLRQYTSAVVNSAALKWVLRNENVATAIPGIGNFDHLRANFPIASNLTLTDEESRFLADNQITLGMEFCRQCRKCLASCPKNVDVPNLMRTHLYAVQYADFQHARQTLDEIDRHRSVQVCTSCSTCSARCANSVNIPRKIGELKLIYA
jgi:predicted aldo/keto reductase-like oxidoreductase